MYEKNIWKILSKAKKKNKFVSGRWPENLNAKSGFFFFFFFWRGAKVNFQVNIHIIIQMVDEFVPSYVPFPMQLLLQSIYLLNICAFMHKYAKLWYFLYSNFFWNQYVVDFLWIFFFNIGKKNEMRRFLRRNEMRAAYWKQTCFFF